MTSMPSLTYHRRAFLRFLAGSPYVAALGGIRAYAQQTTGEIADVITDPKDAFSVMDFEEAAHRKVAAYSKVMRQRVRLARGAAIARYVGGEIWVEHLSG